MQRLLGVVGIIVALYVLGGVALYVYQDQFIYAPPQQDFFSCAKFAESQKISFNGTRMYFKNQSDRMVIHFHGNGGTACDRASLGAVFDKNNLSYILVEYTGFANDSRKPTQVRIQQDVRNALAFARMQNISELIVMGESLGTGPASFATTVDNIDRLILVSPYSSLADVGEARFGIYPMDFLVRDNYDNVRHLDGFNNTLLIMHGSADKVIPINLSKKLAQHVPCQNKTFVEFTDVGHGDIYRRGGAAQLAAFLAQ